MDQTAASLYAEEIGAMYVETSAKDDVNVQDIFTKLSKNLDDDDDDGYHDDGGYHDDD